MRGLAGREPAFFSSVLEQRRTRGLEREMPDHFLAEHVLSPELASAIMELAPANPYCTPSYAEAMRANRRQPWILGTERRGRLKVGCYGFIISGRLDRTLRIESLPNIACHDVFWDGLMRFCFSHRITRLLLNSFASSGVRIPPLPGEVERHARCEYVLDLEDPQWERRLARKHWQNIKRAQQTGVTLRRVSGVDACREHTRLRAASMERRRERGDSIIGDVKRQLPLLILLIEKGAGELFQAVAGGEVLSSGMVIKAARGAYFDSAGNSPEAMKCGASHFLIYSIARVLREEAIGTFNLGDAEPNPNPGLGLFKSRFGARPVSLESASFYLGSGLRRKLTGAARPLRQIGSGFLRRAGAAAALL